MMETANILSSLSQGTTQPISAAERSEASIADTFDTFLTLLTAQLQNQDPLEPLDSNEFTQQLVEFTNVEQGILANKNLEQVIDRLTNNQISEYVAYIDKFIEADSATTGLVDGTAEWHYALGDDALATTLAITDELGRIVWSGPGATTLGRHAFKWDGLDANGEAVPEGVYTLTVHAVDREDIAIATDITTRGKVTGATFADGAPQLLIGLQPIDTNAILQVFSQDHGKTPDSAEGDTLADLLSPDNPANK